MPLTGHRRRDIQGLRALAVAAVVLFHAGAPLPGGFVGVDIFFVISGFVITGLLQREQATHGRIRFGRFYARRFRRLTPALAVVVSVTVLLAALLLGPFGPQQITAKTGAAAMVLGANVVIALGSGGYFDPDTHHNALLHTWSLSVEEQFYLAFPWLLALAWRLRAWRAAPVVLVSTLTGLSFLTAVAGSLGALDGALFGYYSPLTRAWEFGAGALLALLWDRLPTPGQAMSWAVGLLGAGVLAVSFLVIDGSQPFPGLITLLPAVGSVLLLIGGPGLGPIGTALRSRPAVWLGDVSYSVYLWHWPFIVFAQALGPATWWPPALGAALSLLPAVVSYRTVEQRWRPGGAATAASGRSPTAFARLALVTVLVPAVLSAGLFWGAQSGWGSDRITRQQAVTAEAHVGFRPCMDQRAGGGPAPVECRWFTERPGPTVHLVGDSNAGQYSEAVLAAATQLDSPVHVTTASACAYADVYRVTPGLGMGVEDRACRAWFERTASELAQEPPGVVVLAMSMIHWLYRGRAVGTTPDNATRDPAARAALVDTGVVAAIHGLEASGHRVVMIEPMIWLPDAHVAMTACPSTLSIVTGSCPQDVLDLAPLEAEQAPIRAQLRALVEDAGAAWLPVTDRQCPQGHCPAFLGPEPVYLDAGHLSADFSRGLAPSFTAVLRAAADTLRPSPG